MNLKEFVQRRRYALVIIIALLFVLFIGLYIAFSPAEFDKKNGGTNTARQKNINNTPAEQVDKNQIKGDVIILSDGTKIQIPGKTTSASSTTIQTGASGSSGQSIGSSGANLSPGNQSGPGPSVPASPPAQGVFTLGPDATYPDQQIEAPKNNFLIARFNLSNDKAGEVGLTALYLDFAFTDDFSRDDLSNLYVVINGKKYPAISKVSDKGAEWKLSQNVSSGKSVKVEIYGDIAITAVGINDIPDEMISVVKIKGGFNGADVWSGPNESNQYVPGQIIVATNKNIIAGNQPIPPAIPMTSTTIIPPAIPTPPITPIPPTQPIAPSPAGALIAAYNNSTPDNRQVLIGSVEDALMIDVTAENEDIYITKAGFKYKAEYPFGGQFSGIKEFELYGAPDNQSLSGLIGVAQKMPLSDKIEWKWRIIDSNVLKIKKGKTATLTLRVKYELKNGIHSLSGSKLSFELTSLNGMGVESKKDIVAATNNIKSKTAMLVSTKPKITLISKGGNISGGSQEILEFKMEAEENGNNPGLDKIYLNYIDIYTPAVKNSSVKNVTLEPKNVPADPYNIGRCYGIRPYQWRCFFTTNQSYNEIKEGLSANYVVKAEVGLNGDGEFNVKATPIGQLNNYFGGLSFTGALSWNNLGVSGPDMFTWVDGSNNLAVNWKGSGTGALYDSAGPKIVSYKATNGGTAGMIDSGDEIEITFNEPIAPQNLVAGLFPFGTFVNASAGNNGSISYGRTVDANMIVIAGIGRFNQGGASQAGEFATKVKLSDSCTILTIRLDSGTAAAAQSPFIADDGLVDSNNSVYDMNNNKMPVAAIPYSVSMNF